MRNTFALALVAAIASAVIIRDEDIDLDFDDLQQHNDLKEQLVNAGAAEPKRGGRKSEENQDAQEEGSDVETEMIDSDDDLQQHNDLKDQLVNAGTAEPKRGGRKPDQNQAAQEDAEGEAECKDFDGLRDDLKHFWQNFINEGFMNLKDEEEDWKNPCKLPEDWTLEDVPEHWRDEVAELSEEQIEWVTNVCAQPLGSNERVMGLLTINGVEGEELEAVLEKGAGEVEFLYESFSKPIIDGYQEGVRGLLDDCEAVEEFEKAFKEITDGMSIEDAGAAPGEDVIGELEETAEKVDERRPTSKNASKLLAQMRASRN